MREAESGSEVRSALQICVTARFSVADGTPGSGQKSPGDLRARINGVVETRLKLSWLIPVFILFSFVIAFLASPQKPTYLLGTLNESVNCFDDRIITFLNRFAGRAMRWLERAPRSFNAFPFPITQQTMEGFASLHETEALLRTILKFILKPLVGIAGSAKIIERISPLRRID
jgi:hypothetical protein